MAGGTFGGGSGTSASPYLVEDAADLNAVRNNLTAYYEQTADIDLSGYANWTPIGNGYDYSTSFTGAYDGNGFTINNLTIASQAYAEKGLFGIMRSGSLIDINLTNVNISCVGTVGGLVGYIYADDNYAAVLVENCHAKGTVTSSGDYVGMLIGALDVYVSCSLSILNCSANGFVSTSHWEIGGLIGEVFIENYNDNNPAIGVLKNCSFTGIAKATNQNSQSFLGGLFGEVCAGELSTITIEECFVNADVSGYLIVGGFSPDIEAWDGGNVQVVNCYVLGSVSATTDAAAGFAPILSPGNPGSVIEIINCYSAASVSYGSYSSCGGFVGDAVGYDEGVSIITGCFYDSETSGQSDTGKGEPKTTAEMKTQSTFNGWDFTDIWGINTSINDGYPYLLMEIKEPPVPLPQVGKPIWEDYKVTWEDVENASSYVVRLYNDAGTVVAIQRVAQGVRVADFTNLLSEGTFTVTVQASEVVL